MFDETNTYMFFDLIKLKLLPTNWEHEIRTIAENYSYETFLDGKSSTSREPENAEAAKVFVVEGDVIKEKLPWLIQLYSSDLLLLANSKLKNNFQVSENIKSGININFLRGRGDRYEWHVDSNPLTGLLFVTNHDEESGGELIFKRNGKIISVYPKKGLFLLFDAREVPHCVQPLKKETFRISIPMNYYIKGNKQDRPEDLDHYIYRKSS